MRGRFKKTNGRHAYLGRYNSRGTRTMSKLHKGMSECGDLKATFEKIEQERKKQKETENANKM